MRVVVATNRNLHERMLHGEFRADLYYRLNVFPLLVPPLRERREDISALVPLFLATVTRKLGKRFDGVAPGFIEQLMAYDWPGNVRELQNIVERAAILSRRGDRPVHR
jgi:transcriptional regulator with GAF, ATPase, and Fis domain